MPVLALFGRTCASDGARVRVLMALAVACCALVVPALAQAGPEEDMHVLQYVEAEEVVSRDLMAAFAEVYADPTLVRIARDERQHARTLERILGKGSLQRASEDGSAGVLVGYAGHMEQYWQWLSLGYRDLRSAAEAGIAAEKQHLAVLDATIAALADPTLRRQLKQIRRQDARHLTMLQNLWSATAPAQPCVTERC
ncbi:MAG: hypothetical protein ACKOMX_07905 [Actinomycetota bacterium]